MMNWTAALFMASLSRYLITGNLLKGQYTIDWTTPSLLPSVEFRFELGLGFHNNNNTPIG